jgi:CRISPR system Cascade subunit CasD
MNNTLFLRLEGVMQSWDVLSRWSVRECGTEPSKSGVCGLLACCAGINDKNEILKLARSIRIGVRVDNQGEILDDFQTIGGGYGKPMLLNGELKLKRNVTGSPFSALDHRMYLINASFLVAVMSHDGRLIEMLSQFIQNPVWVPYLGRKCCPPSLPIFDGVGHFQELKEALISKSVPVFNSEGDTAMVKLILELPSPNAFSIRRHDDVGQGDYAGLAVRYTVEEMIELPVMMREV